VDTEFSELARRAAPATDKILHFGKVKPRPR
jgi:hypothetical protein